MFLRGSPAGGTITSYMSTGMAGGINNIGATFF